MKRSNKVSATKISIITCLVIDFSSKLCFEEKQSFEENSIIEHVIIEIFVAETLFDLLMHLLTIIELLKDLMDKP